MKKKRLQRNEALIRVRRGARLTQELLAERIGTSAQTIRRWERGESLPQPLYRERLRALFRASDEQLGLVDLEYARQEAPPLIDPLLPPPPVLLMGRLATMEQLQQWLMPERRRKTIDPVILTGAPGVGKTALALTLAHELRASQVDGILYASLGPVCDARALLTHWATWLGIASPTPNEAQLHRQLRAYLASRRMLLILDDVWRLEDARRLMVTSSSSIMLVTTRSPAMAAALSLQRTMRVPDLKPDDALTLVQMLAPSLSDQPQVKSILQAVGHLPLAVQLIGLYLRIESATGSPRRQQEALKRLAHPAARFALEEPVEGTVISLRSSIARSAGRVSHAAQLTLTLLAGQVASKPAVFSEEQVRSLVMDLADLDALCDVGLLESNGRGRYQLHPTIADYARLFLHPDHPETAA